MRDLFHSDPRPVPFGSKTSSIRIRGPFHSDPRPVPFGSMTCSIRMREMTHLCHQLKTFECSSSFGYLGQSSYTSRTIVRTVPDNRPDQKKLLGFFVSKYQTLRSSGLFPIVLRCSIKQRGSLVIIRDHLYCDTFANECLFCHYFT